MTEVISFSYISFHYLYDKQVFTSKILIVHLILILCFQQQQQSALIVQQQVRFLIDIKFLFAFSERRNKTFLNQVLDIFFVKLINYSNFSLVSTGIMKVQNHQ